MAKYYYFAHGADRFYRVSTQALELCMRDLEKNYPGAAYVLRQLRDDARLRAAAYETAKKAGAPYRPPMPRRIYSSEVTPLCVATRATPYTMNVLLTPRGLLWEGVCLVWAAPGPDSVVADEYAAQDRYRLRRLHAMFRARG